jgi:hypothetical protein
VHIKQIEPAPCLLICTKFIVLGSCDRQMLRCSYGYFCPNTVSILSLHLRGHKYLPAPLDKVCRDFFFEGLCAVNIHGHLSSRRMFAPLL